MTPTTLRHRPGARRPAPDLPEPCRAPVSPLSQAVGRQLDQHLPRLAQAGGVPILRWPDQAAVTFPPAQALALDLGGLLAWGPRAEVSLLTEDPYANWEDTSAPWTTRLSDAHLALCASRRVVAVTRPTWRAVQVFHTQRVEHRPLPALPWPKLPGGVDEGSVLISADAAYAAWVTPVQTRLQGRLPEAWTWRLAVGEALQRQAVNQALQGAPDGPGAARLHVIVGPAPGDADLLRLHESWAAGLPVLQFMPRLHGGAVLDDQHRVQHGRSGLLAQTFEELDAHADLLWYDAAFVEGLRLRARAHLGRTVPSWQAYLQDILGEVSP